MLYIKSSPGLILEMWLRFGGKPVVVVKSNASFQVSKGSWIEALTYDYVTHTLSKISQLIELKAVVDVNSSWDDPCCQESKLYLL